MQTIDMQTMDDLWTVPHTLEEIQDKISKLKFAYKVQCINKNVEERRVLRNKLKDKLKDLNRWKYNQYMNTYMKTQNQRVADNQRKKATQEEKELFIKEVKVFIVELSTQNINMCDIDIQALDIIKKYNKIFVVPPRAAGHNGGL